MPRQAQAPHASARPKGILSPQKGSMRGPLQDDRQEKSIRLQSRQALQEIQLNQIKAAAASPVRKVSAARHIASPRTPSRDDVENEGSQGLSVLGGKAPTPMKRMPILANFEEWMKMATDNKINATNSWNFALIDYFHDMSLLKEGDGVNFQKASCTLDGCVKIYTSRVDSVATETGKLLSGLADSGNKKRKGDGEDVEHGEEDDDEEDGEDGVKKKTRKRVQRSSEATLASSFAQLQLKKMDLEFSIDPLFKKTSADFDEGGAKGLLLNHLTIDPLGRIVFDSSEDASDEQEHQEQEQAIVETITDAVQPDCDIDLDSLAAKFFPDLLALDEQEICPSMKTYELGSANASLDIPFLKAAEDWRKDESTPPDATSNVDNNGTGFDDDEDGMIGGFSVAADVGFGEGGEAWAKEAAIDTQARPYDGSHRDQADDGEVGGYQADSDQYGVVLQREKDFDRENILSYFDQALQKNWAGPEHWRIRKIKDANKPTAPTAKRKEKEPFEIDFAAPMTQAMSDLIYTRATSNSTISLPKSQWKSKTRNLLPDDKHFNSRQLLSLFLKPQARIGSRKISSRPVESGYQGELDEAYWAKQQDQANSQDLDEGVSGNYDANFFQDDGLGMAGGLDEDDEDFADAREHLSPEAGQPTMTQGSINSLIQDGTTGEGFGTQLVTQSRRLRPEYVQYARVAKKVDVRRLKEEMWKGIDFQEEPRRSSTSEEAPFAPPAKGQELKFTSVMNNLQAVYPKQAMTDISTSYCFICLLHLANEKGLVLEHEANFDEIRIQKDYTAEITEHGE